MKKIIIILLSVIGFSGCLDEGGDGCPGYFRLRFLLDGPTRADAAEGHDIYLYEFQNGIFYADRLIPYEEIKNGNEYNFRKEYGGRSQFIAVSVRRDAGGKESGLGGNGSLDSYSLELKVNESGEYESIGNVYLGNESAESEITENSLVEIGMLRANCNLEVKVYDNVGVLTGTGSTIEVTGTKSSMGIDFRGTGKDAVIRAGLSLIESDTYTSGRLGLLPSAEDEVIIITILQDGVPAYRIDTEQQSVSGKDITVTTSLGTVAEITVDGWRTKSVNIERL